MLARVLWCVAGVASLAAGPAPEVQVVIENFTFVPQSLVVAAGTRVTWINQDDIPHTVFNVETPAAMHSRPLDTDDRFVLVLDRPGVYHFFCTLHPHMQSEIRVQ